MAEAYSVGSPTTDAEVERLADALGMAFRVTRERSLAYFDRIGRRNLRVVRHGREIAGGLALISMGQWFGGVSVPMVGIAAVAILPEYRGRGAGSALMRQAVLDVKALGAPLSTLYPATQPIYRRVGYEQAGSRYETRLDPRAIDVHERTLSIRPIRTPEDEAEAARVYRESARRTAGNLDRNDFIWKRVKQPAEKPAQGYLIHRDGVAEGYLYYTQRDARRKPYSLNVTDVAALTPEASKRILAFFADHRSVVEEVIFYARPQDPMLFHLAEQTAEVRLFDHWMMRIVDVAGALEARAYPPGLSVRMEIEVHGDGVLPEVNNGRFIVKVREGRASVERGGSGRLRVHLNALAPMYTGFWNPMELVETGLVEGDEESSRAAAAAFAGPAPWMPDHF